MEELQKLLISKITEILKSDYPDAQLLAVFNQLLGTVSTWLIATEH